MNWKDNLQLQNLAPIKLDADMAQFTTYKAGGKAEVLAMPESETQLKNILNFCKANNVGFRIFGLGSNILVSDSGLEGIICTLRNMTGVQIKGNTVQALSGTPLDKVVEAAVNAGLGGMECLSGIPGSVGGAIYMNAGAFEQETFDFITDFTALTLTGESIVKTKNEVNPKYRNVQGLDDLIVITARWQLPFADKQAISAKRTDILKRRAEKQPLEYPSAGSVFKRPADDYASRLIDISGLKGLSIGGAEVSSKHAGFIINKHNATAADIKKLIEEVRKQVKEKTGVSLETEQLMWGQF